MGEHTQKTICEQCGTTTRPTEWHRDGEVTIVSLCVNCQFSEMDVLGGRFVTDDEA